MIKLIFFILFVLNIEVASASSSFEKIKISPFGITLDEQYQNFKYDIYNHGKKIKVNPENPMLDFFENYEVILLSDNTVFSVYANGNFDTNKFKCFELLKFLSDSFSSKYNLEFKNHYFKDMIILKTTDHYVSFSCRNEIVFFELTKNETLPPPVKNLNPKFKDIITTF